MTHPEVNGAPEIPPPLPKPREEFTIADWDDFLLISPTMVRGLVELRARRSISAWATRCAIQMAVTPAHANSGHPAAMKTGSARARTARSNTRNARSANGASDVLIA